jgi:hypothetical protein
MINAAYAADISLMSSSLTPVNKSKPVKISHKLKIQEDKVTKINPALILELPSNKFLGKQFNSSEKSELQSIILEIAYKGLIDNDPRYKQYLSQNNKTNSIVSILGSVMAFSSGHSRINYSHQDSQHEKYLQEKFYLLRKLTESYMVLFESPQRSKDAIKAYELTRDFTDLVGVNSVIEINKLLQRY